MKPTCFISYSWDSEAHKQWVRRLAGKFSDVGIDAILDQTHLPPGGDIPSFMEAAIGRSHCVLIVCTRNYARRANSRRGGVGMESMVITGEMLERGIKTTKFVPVLREGPASSSVPRFMKGRRYLDLSSETAEQASLPDLLNHLLRALPSRPSNASLARRSTTSPAPVEHAPAVVVGPQMRLLDELKRLELYFYSDEKRIEWVRENWDVIKKYNLDEFIKLMRFHKDRLGGWGTSSAAWALELIPLVSGFVDTLTRLHSFALSERGLMFAVPGDALEWTYKHFHIFKTASVDEFLNGFEYYCPTPTSTKAALEAADRAISALRKK